MDNITHRWEVYGTQEGNDIPVWYDFGKVDGDNNTITLTYPAEESETNPVQEPKLTVSKNRIQILRKKRILTQTKSRKNVSN